MSTISYSELDYRRPKGVYHYPEWAITIGWIIAAMPISWIPIYAVYKAIIYKLHNKVVVDNNYNYNNNNNNSNYW